MLNPYVSLWCSEVSHSMKSLIMFDWSVPTGWVSGKISSRNGRNHGLFYPFFHVFLHFSGKMGVDFPVDFASNHFKPIQMSVDRRTWVFPAGLAQEYVRLVGWMTVATVTLLGVVWLDCNFSQWNCRVIYSDII